ncbi:MAG: hypothetical protein ACJ76S_10565 [Solirubrobacteraceae bacterium]|jgi:hypothetical protein
MESSERRERQAHAAADEMDARAAKMEDHSDELDREVADTRGDWRRKQQDSSVPGAEPEHEERSGEVVGDWQGEGQEAEEAGQ